jgi:hypothetical protein
MFTCANLISANSRLDVALDVYIYVNVNVKQAAGEFYRKREEDGGFLIEGLIVKIALLLF